MRKIVLLLLLFCFACGKKDYGPPPVTIPPNAVFQKDLHKAPDSILGTWRYTLERSSCGGGFMVNVLSTRGKTCREFIAAEHEQFVANMSTTAPGLQDTMKFIKARLCDMDGTPCLYTELAVRNLRQVQEDDPMSQAATYLICGGDKAALISCLMSTGSDLTDAARAELRALAETYH